jgi:hypothetical protein
MDVSAVGVELIDAWAERVLVAESLEQIFRPREPGSK